MLLAKNAAICKPEMKEENVTAFETYLDELADHPRERREAGHRSEELSERFDTPAFGRAVEKVYEDAIQQ